jgi:hypothetical protein
LVFSGAGGAVTAIGSPRGCAVIDTGYAPRVNEIRQNIARCASVYLKFAPENRMKLAGR